MLTTVSPLHHQRRTAPLEEFAPDELFFSITDDRGVIQHANSVFTRLSGYSFEEMQGQPHNIVRDPAMPRGAFQLIWAEMLAGRPVAGYVANRSRSGSRYEVFAVMLPTDGGYISVRLRPDAGGMRDTVFDILDRARGFEDTVQGSAREQAEAGAAFILAELAKLGIPDMETLTKRTLPREVMSTVEAIAELEYSAGREPLEILPGKIRMLGRLMASSMRSLEPLDAASLQVHRIVSDSSAVAATFEQLDRVVQEVTESLAWNGASGAGDGKDLADAAAELREHLQRAQRSYRDTLTQSTELRDEIEMLAQNMGVFTLQNQMIGRFAVELLGGSVAEPPGSSMRLLHQTLAEQLVAVTEGVARVNHLAHTTPESTTRTSSQLDALARPLATWTALAERVLARQGAEASPTVASQVHLLRAEAQHGFNLPDTLADRVAELSRVEVGIEELPLQATVKFVGMVTADIA